MKSCPVPDCRGIRADDKLLCWECWQRVPMPLQLAVYNTFRALRRCRSGRQLEQARPAYELAAKAAIEIATKARAA